MVPRRSAAGFLVVMALGASCGRLEYDPIADASPVIADAAGDASRADAETGDGGSSCLGTEGCNGVDDDCDANVDEGCPCTRIQTFVTIDDRPIDPAVDWTGSGFGVLWNGDPPPVGGRALFFRVIDALGVPLGPAIQVTTEPQIGAWDLAWNGIEHGVLSIEMAGTDLQARLHTIDARGSVVSPAVDVSPLGASHAAVIGTPRGFVVASVVGEQLYVHRFEGGEHSEHLLGTLGMAVLGIELAADADGGMVGVSPRTPAPALLLPLDRELRARGPVVSGSDVYSKAGVVRAASPDRWLVALPRPLETALRPVDGLGALASTEVVIAATSSTLGLTRAGPDAVLSILDTTLRFTTMRLDPDTGTALEAPVVDGTAGNPRGTPALAGAAGRVAIAWMTTDRVELIQRCF